MRKVQPYFTAQQLRDNYVCEIPTEILPATLNTKLVTENVVEKEEKLPKMLLSIKLEREKQMHEFGIYGKAKPVLSIVFKNKCAFCECDISAGAAYDVEHFRPKKGDINKTHTGYYWLGYEWSNFLLSCQKCNREHKKNNFPIIGTRLISPNLPLQFGDATHNINDKTLSNEQILLLHPALDDPSSHLLFYENGNVKPNKDSENKDSEKGVNSIKTYGLKRKVLVENRKRIVSEYQKRILRLYKKDILPTDEQLTTTLEGVVGELVDDIYLATKPYIAFRTTILQNFTVFIIDNKFDDIDMPEPRRLGKLYIKLQKELGLP